jgi:hypothetical protein
MNYLVLILLSALVSSSVFAYENWLRSDYRILSEIPYEECEIVNADRSEVTFLFEKNLKEVGRFFFQSQSADNRDWFRCVSDELNIELMVPIEIYQNNSENALADFEVRKGHLQLNKINGKPFQSILGEYSGNLLMGLKNKRKVELQLVSKNMPERLATRPEGMLEIKTSQKAKNILAGVVFSKVSPRGLFGSKKKISLPTQRSQERTPLMFDMQ